VTGWNGADGDVERRKAISQRGQEVQEGRGLKLVVVLDEVGCQLPILSEGRCGRSGSVRLAAAQVLASGSRRAAGSPLGTGDRKPRKRVAGGMRKGVGFWISEFGVQMFRNGAGIVGSEKIYATGLRFL